MQSDPDNIPDGFRSASGLEKALRAGEFVYTTELNPPDSANPADVFRAAEDLGGVAHAINATDASGANCHMSSIGICALLTRQKYETVYQISCRDRNRIAIQGDVLGAAAMGVCNVLCLSGDGVETGDQPGSKPVFDLDSISLLRTIRTMRDEGVFLSGRKLTSRPRLFLGAAENPCAPPYEWRFERLAKKIDAGADFVQTNFIFDLPIFEKFMGQVRDHGLHKKVFIIAGVGPLASAKSAQWIRKNIPGIHIPDQIIERLDAAEDQAAEGLEICVELVQRIQQIEGVAGAHIMAYKSEHLVPEIIRRAEQGSPRCGRRIAHETA